MNTMHEMCGSDPTAIHYLQVLETTAAGIDAMDQETNFPNGEKVIGTPLGKFKLISLLKVPYLSVMVMANETE